MPDINFASKDVLPEELREFAKEVEGGGVVINLVPNDKLKQFRENNIALSQERDTLKSTVSVIEQIFPDFDAEKVTLELGDLRNIAKRVKDGELKESKAIEEALNERTKTMKQQYEESLATRSKALKDAQDRAAAVDQKLRRQAVKQAVLSVVMDPNSGVQPTAANDIVMRAYSVFQSDDDGEKLTPKIGDSILYGADGTTPMSTAEWVSTLKDSSPHLFKSSNGGGGGGSDGQKVFGGFTRAEMDKMSPEDKLRIANEASRPKGY